MNVGAGDGMPYAGGSALQSVFEEYNKKVNTNACTGVDW
jgi:hypothetical protein